MQTFANFKILFFKKIKRGIKLALAPFQNKSKEIKEKIGKTQKK